MDFFWCICNRLYHIKFQRLARIFELISFIISSHAVSGRITLGNDVKFYHHAMGCVISGDTVIGNNTSIFQNVTIGYDFSKNKGKYSGGV